MPLNIKTGGGANKLPPRLVVIGHQKVGKSTFASQADKVVFLPTEDGCSQIDGLQQFPKANSWTEVLEFVVQLGTEDHDFKWLCIDTLDGAEAMCRQHVVDRDFNGSLNNFSSYGKGYAAMTAEFKLLFDYIDRLREKKRMGSILLAHVGVQAVNSPIEGDYTKYTGEMDKRTWSLTKSWADQIAFASYDFTVLNSNDSEGKKGKAKLMSDNRHLFFQGHAGLDVGCRAGFEMPERIALEWSEYRDELAKHYSKKGGAK